jgi:hypothetical protein
MRAGTDVFFVTTHLAQFVNQWSIHTDIDFYHLTRLRRTDPVGEAQSWAVVGAGTGGDPTRTVITVQGGCTIDTLGVSTYIAPNADWRVNIGTDPDTYVTLYSANNTTKQIVVHGDVTAQLGVGTKINFYSVKHPDGIQYGNNLPSVRSLPGLARNTLIYGGKWVGSEFQPVFLSVAGGIGPISLKPSQVKPQVGQVVRRGGFGQQAAARNSFGG